MPVQNPKYDIFYLAPFAAINTGMSNEKSIETVSLEISRILAQWNVDHEVTGCVARNMVDAHTSGHSTHGVQLLPRYKKWLEMGILTRHAALEQENSPSNLIQFNAHKSFGHWALPAAIKQVAEIDTVVKAFGIKNLGHTGYVAGCLKECKVDDHVILVWLNTSSSRLVTPYGGKGKLMSSSVIACRIPGGYVLDMTTPVTAENAVHHALNSGRTLDRPLLMENGSHTHDPTSLYTQTSHGLNALVSKTSIPFNDHKMFNLGLVSEILAGLLTRSGTSQGSSFHSGCFGIMIKADSDLAMQVRQYLGWIKAESGARLPGDLIQSAINLLPWETKILEKFKED